MAEQERLTKAERRELKRQRRQEEERQAAEQARRDRRRNVSYALSLFVVVGVLVWLAVGNLGTDLDGAITLTRAEADEAQSAAECERLDVQEITDAQLAPLGITSRQHIEPASAPAADQLYVNGRPTASGPHFTNPLPIVNGVRDEPIDERASTHNLEHGSIIVWIDPEQVPDEEIDAIADWVELLNDNGFAENSGRAGIMASYVNEAGIDSGKPLAIRGWGVAMDCSSWDEDWANGFVLDHYGPRGTAPEQFQEFPAEALAYSGDGAEDSGTEDSGTEDSGTDDTGTDDSGTEDTGAEDPGADDTASSEPTEDEG